MFIFVSGHSSIQNVSAVYLTPDMLLTSRCVNRLLTFSRSSGSKCPACLRPTAGTMWTTAACRAHQALPGAVTGAAQNNMTSRAGYVSVEGSVVLHML
jgi:hypothetical protein